MGYKRAAKLTKMNGGTQFILENMYKDKMRKRKKQDNNSRYNRHRQKTKEKVYELKIKTQKGD
jgi:hypothetical protein